ncbi:MAG TPA: AEC family transporter [Methanoregula sp.]|nr:AEC family transporter [Methanoregula sp.]
MDLVTIFLAILSLFVIIGVGFVLRRYELLNGDRVHLISHILVNIALPAITISSMQVPHTAKTMSIVNSMLLVSCGYFIAAIVVSILICHFLPSTPKEKGVFEFMLVFPNTMFMGIPVALAVLGPDSLFYVTLFNVPIYFLVFTLGVWLLARGRPGKFDFKVLLSPGLVASFVGLALFLAGYTIPAPAETVLELVGSATTPLAMLVVGALLATLPVSRLAGDWRVHLVTGLRLIVFPVIAFAVLLPFVSDKTLLGVAVLLIAMPVAANIVLLSEEYKVDSTLASQGVFLSTLLCLITIPALEFLLF